MLLPAILLAFPAPAVELALDRSARLAVRAALVAFAPELRWTPRRAPPARLELAPLPAEVLAQLVPGGAANAVSELAGHLRRGSDVTLDALLAGLEQRRLCAGSEPTRMTPDARGIVLSALHAAPSARVLDALQRMPEISDQDVRRRTHVEVLGAVGTKTAFERLLGIAGQLDRGALESEPGRQWIEATAFSLARVPEHHELLRRSARKLDASVQLACVQATGAAGDPLGLPYLGDLLLRRAACTREALAAVRAIGPCGDADENERVANLARGFLDRWDAPLCQEAALTLAALEDFAAIPELIELLAEDDPGLRAVAGRSLRSLTGLALPDELEAWQAWKLTEERWIDADLERALERLASEDPAEIVAGLRLVRGHRTLRSELEGTLLGLLDHSDPGVRANGCAALAEIGGERARAALELALEDTPAVAEAARRALASWR